MWRFVTASGASAGKTYDGNTVANATLAITGGLVGAETVSATGSATFNSKDVLTANQITVNTRIGRSTALTLKLSALVSDCRSG